LRSLFFVAAFWACASSIAFADDKAQPVSAAAPLPVEAFFSKPAFDAGELSPNGKFVALAQVGAGKDDPEVVVIHELATGETKAILKLNVKGITVDWLLWKNDNRLVLGLTELDIKRQGDRPNGEIVSYRYGNFLMALDRDGKNLVQFLKGNFWNPHRGSTASLLDKLRDDPDHILAAAPDGSGETAAWKVDVHTGEAVNVEPGRRDVQGWRTDSTGAIVIRYRADNWAAYIESRAPGAKDWTLVTKLKEKDFKALEDFEIRGAADKPSELYVAVKPKDKSEGEARRLRIYDVAAHKLSDPIWPALKYDLTNIVYEGDTTTLAGVCYTADTYVCDFKDKVTEANFKGLSNYFGGDRNLVPISYSGDGKLWLLNVSGPNEPSAYYLFDQAKARIELLSVRFEKLPADGLSKMERFVYKARDGVAIPAYLSRPPGAPAGPLPLIVMPHGGPEDRDNFDFDLESQFLSTRGYLVLQPNFRGSSGYGIAFAEAGYHQWGGLMADDVTDGVKALIASGQVDPKRICIFGGSYGGYAALYAGATHPELYKCVVSWAGPGDLIAALHFQRDQHGTESETYKYWVKAIGDPNKDSAALKAASPLTYAATYQPPVLLIHGEDDGIVDVNASRAMNSALSRAGRSVKLVTFKNEGHRNWVNEDEEAGLTEVAKFIEAHIAPAPLAPPAPPTQTASVAPPPAKP
jgi:dipeptidyl aminopeptidase/acylaminoacyl peptidase